ncbi:hypothetical protein E2I00_008573 [Balaenoptera physalus]|uniref:Uncharacterized protein n=1 Tax=Balaenoptera physalus TaxID=9770 RepID=A0A643BN94_BALPH|nr:hypothetical protein E2I00_008573 [Balaenoptera physalus]
MKKLQPKVNSDGGEVFQTVMLETRESREIRDFYFKEIQENMHDFEYQWRDDERNGKGLPITCKENLTYKRNQPWKRDAGNKPVENRLGSSFRDKLLIYQAEGKIYECNQAVKSTNSRGSFSILESSIPPSVQANISNIYGNDLIHLSDRNYTDILNVEIPLRNSVFLRFTKEFMLGRILTNEFPDGLWDGVKTEGPNSLAQPPGLDDR